ncbi:MAG: hypothetical protein OSB51_03535, partial [Dokdonia donghaensis]|nr:hypothetical protein [Dokdonia donghaensis]
REHLVKRYSSFGKPYFCFRESVKKTFIIFIVYRFTLCYIIKDAAYRIHTTHNELPLCRKRIKIIW